MNNDFTLAATAKGLLETLQVQVAEDWIARKQDRFEKLALAQDQYDRSLKPIFDMLAALPEINGKKFTVEQPSPGERSGEAPFAYLVYEAKNADPTETPPPSSIEVGIRPDPVFGSRVTRAYTVVSTEARKEWDTVEQAGEQIAHWLNKNALPEHILLVNAGTRSVAAPNPKP